MKATGIVRKVDELGRIVLPKELRKTMDLPEGTPMEIFTEGDSIVITKYQPSCVFCGNSKETEFFKDRLICNNCRNDFRR